MQVLVALATARPKVVSRNQLIDSCWNGRVVSSASINRCILALRKLAKQIDPEPFEIGTVPRVGYSLVERGYRSPINWHVIAAGLIIAGLALVALLVWKPFATIDRATVAVVVPSDSSAVSRDFARDLLVKLGTLESVGGNPVELVGAPQRKRADLLFEVSGSTDARQIRASVALMKGTQGSVLWSKDFNERTEQAGDLRQQLAYTTAQVLECGLEAHAGGRSILKTDTLKVYLNGCAELANPQGKTSADLVAPFRQVIAAAPKFQDGWYKLIISEADEYILTRDPRLREQLKRDIAEARTINPHIAAAYLAESDLLPLGAYAERMSLADRAIRSGRDDPVPLRFRSAILFSVGRLNEAIDDTQRAVQLDPLAPRTREMHIGTLADAGRMEAALEELRKAERVWPDSSSLATVKFRINLRYGDPRFARQVIRSGKLSAGWGDAESFLQARIDPTPRNIERAIENARTLYERHPGTFQNLVQTLSIFDRELDLLSLLMRAPLETAISVTDVMFRPAARDFWRDPRSLSYAKRVGLLQYWRASRKWPDFCYEAELPYDCKTEAEKLAP